MNHNDLPSSYLALSASGDEACPAPEMERTVQIALPADALPRQITPGGMRRDWRLMRHLLTGVALLLLVVGLLARLPVSPRVTASQTLLPQKPVRLPVAPAPTSPSFTPPSYYAPPTPSVFQSPPNGVSFPLTPPSGASQVETPLASRSDFGAGPACTGVGYVVPASVPMAA